MYKLDFFLYNSVWNSNGAPFTFVFLKNEDNNDDDNLTDN